MLAQVERQREWARAQARFVANAAHQLKAPLTSLTVLAEQALRETDPAAVRGAVVRMRATAAATGRLVGQLLSLARSESGGSRERSNVALHVLAQEVTFDLLLAARARRIDLGFEAHATVAVEGEPGLLRELLTNLVHNAVSYTQEGGVVTVRVALQDGRPRVTVVDNGPSIPLPERVRVVERFYRVAGATPPGTGLGLAIAEEICARHAIRMSLHDAPDGGPGLCVALTWPSGQDAISWT